MNLLAGKITVDFRSSEPIYLQIARQIEQLVVQGELKLGDQLPTVRELAAELRINFNTVTRSYKVLDEARVISTQRGRGTYIWEEPDPAALHTLRKEGLKALLQRCIEDSSRMGFDEDELVRVFSEQVRVWKASAAAGPSTEVYPQREE